MKRIYLTLTPRRGTVPDKACDDALEALSRSVFIDRAEGSTGLFGSLRRRDYKRERGEV
jgi:hypothetical protein